MYIYESHMGNGYYVSNVELCYNDTYCETCGDGDYYLGYATTKEEALKLIDITAYDKEKIEKFLENFEDS